MDEQQYVIDKLEQKTKGQDDLFNEVRKID